MTFMHKIAEACMPFLYFIQSIRIPLFDWFFSLVTHLGEETFFLVIAILFFWCINKREGYFILITGLVGTLVNQLAKLFFRIPRPWVLDPDFEIVESARAEATGYSFPSGHTQNIAGTYGSIAAFQPKKWKTILCVSIIMDLLGIMDKLGNLGSSEGTDGALDLVDQFAVLGATMDTMKQTSCINKLPPLLIEGLIKNEMLADFLKPSIVFQMNEIVANNRDKTYYDCMNQIAVNIRFAINALGGDMI